MARQWIPIGEICAWKDASSNAAALEALKEQGLEIGGQELWDLAAGRLTLANMNALRRAELSKTAAAARPGKTGKES